jgi:ketosteroid isomerase-like protein
MGDKMYRLGLATLITFIGLTFVSNIPNSGVLACGMNRDESQILLIDKAWSRAAKNKDIDGVIAPYATDGSILPFNAPMATGTAAIRQAWSLLMSKPGYGLTFSPTRIFVSASGDIAWEIGIFELKLNDAGGISKLMLGKYMVMWKKVDGDWRVAADMFKTNN